MIKPPFTETFPVALNASMEGHFLFEKHRLGETPQVAADFHNLITDSGLRHYLGDGTSTTRSTARCDVGSSATPESPSQTAIQAKIASQLVDGNPTYQHIGGTPFLIRIVSTYRFGEGQAQGNIAEVTVGPGAIAATGIACRALVRDSLGQPVTIPVANDEFLTVTYTLDIYVDVSDKNFTLNLTSGTHDCVLRPINLPGAGLPSLIVGLSPSTLTGSHISSGGLVPVTNTTVGPTLKSVVWTSEGGDPPGSTTHRDWEYSLAPVQGNDLPGGIVSLTVVLRYWISYQISFDPPLPKTALRKFKIKLRFSIGRR